MQKDKQDAQVAIIGAGFSGTIAAVQLARRGIDVVLVGRGDQAGKGVAYSTEDPAHLLNIPAAKMSAWPDRPDDFVDAIADEGFGPEDYVPRMLFGRYLRRILDESAVTLVERGVVAVARSDDAWTVQLADGRTIKAAALVLALGNQPPDALPFALQLPERLFASDPWGAAGRAAIAAAVASGGDMLVIGSGLSMVDVALSLDAAGHKGKLIALSRRGQMPRVSFPLRSEVPSSDPAPSGSLADLWRWVRTRSTEIDWRDAVDSVRPRTHELWRSLSEVDQRRFIRHARPWWDIHRHRVAPQVGATVKRMIKSGRMEVIGGRIKSLREMYGGIEAVVRRRRATEADAPQQFSVGINCTGPLHAIKHTNDGVLRSLLDAGLVEPDHLGIGLKVDDQARVIGAARLWAMGSLGKGRYWEIIAVPDIRVQAEMVADSIARELNDDAQS
ncbi:MAG: FAD/NAD(P)-binding protein [Sphingomonas bacterium]|nr:FAD/NAD(P)-binding protein [Sphingomonas bacterium]